MNIAVFSENRNDYWSGGRWYPWFMGHVLASLGHKVILSTNNLPTFDKCFEEFPGRENINILVCKHYGIRKDMNKIFKGGFDLTIGSPIWGAEKAVTFAEIFKCKSMILCYEPNNWIEEKSGRDDILLPGQNWSSYINASRKCDKFLCNAKLPAKYARKWIPEISDRIDYLFNGINTVTADKIKRILSDKRKNQVVYVSRSDLYKGFEDIGKYFSDLKDKPKIIFITGMLKKENEEKLLDICQNIGLELEVKILIDDQQKFQLISESKALFFPSKWEGFGIPPAEAFYLSVPVICYDLPITKEIYRDFPHYLRLENEEHNKKLMKKLFTDNDFLFRKIKAAREYVTKFAAFENYAQHLNEKIANVFKAPLADKVEKVSSQQERSIISKLQPKKKASDFSKSDLKPKFVSNKKVSIVIPYYNGNLQYLSECVQSIDRQTHKNKEIIFLDDGTTDKECKKAIKIIEDAGEWRLIKHEKNQGIPKSMTDGVKAATGDIIIFLDADDTLRDRALEIVTLCFEQNNNLKMLYTNEVHMNENGEIFAEERKPNWNIECLYTGQYLNHLTAFKADFLKKMMPCSEKYGRSWDYDLMLRIAEKTSEIKHIPKILYNWRIHGGQFGGGEGAYIAQENAISALNAHLKRIKLDKKKQITQTPNLGFYGSKHRIKRKPKILVITMTRDIHYLGQLLISMEKHTHIPYDHLIVHHEPKGNWDKNILEYFKVKDLWFELEDGEFNFSKTHNKMIEKHGDGYDYFVLLNDDIILNDRWLEESIAMFDYRWDKVGVVGIKLMYPNDEDIRKIRLPKYWMENVATIQHAGVCLLKDRGAAHCYVNRPSNMRAINFAREFETVTFAVVTIDSKCFNEIKMNEKYDSDLNDMVFCINAKRKGWKIIYTPWANGIHLTSVTREKYGIAGKVENQVAFRKEFKEEIEDKMNYPQMLKAEEEGL